MIGRIREIVADVLAMPPDEVGADARREDLPRWDSMQNLNVAIALEQEFDVAFEPEDFERIDGVPALAAMVRDKLARR